MNLKLSVALLLWLSSYGLCCAGTVPVDLYRSGNSTSPRMDNVRDVDVVKFTQNGVTWVRGKQAGISSFSTAPADPKNWWRVPRGTIYSNDIYLVNDQGTHWSWAPVRDMPFTTFVQLMQAANALFTKLQ